jgi:hypothetical protein
MALLGKSAPISLNDLRGRSFWGGLASPRGLYREPLRTERKAAMLRMGLTMTLHPLTSDVRPFA